MTVSVIPAIRTPRNVEVFDYAVPVGMTVRAGDLVWIPFRTKRLVGLVRQIMTDAATDKPLKTIEGPYAGLHLNDRTLALLDACATRSLSSKPTALHAWLGALPKRPKDIAARPLQPSLLAAREDRLLAARWSGANGIIATVKKTLKDGKRVLILTPWSRRAAWLADRCRAGLLTSELSAGERFRAWSSYLSGERRALVATRLGAWLVTESDLIILDEPENDDHKQDELAPRYDARWLAEEAARLGVSLMTFGLTSRLAADLDQWQRLAVSGKRSKDTGPLTAHCSPISAQPPTLTPRLTLIDIHRADWSPLSGLQRRAVACLEEARQAGRDIFIVHPIHGERARLRCADCGWLAACERCGAGLTVQSNRLVCQRCRFKADMALACPACGGHDLSRSRPGRERLTNDLRAHGYDPAASGIQVLSIGEWNDLVELPPKPLVILTDLSLYAGVGEDARRKERLIIAFRRLADICQTAGAELVVQSDPLLVSEAKVWLTSEGCTRALQREISERGQFGLPPATRLVKIILRDPEQAAPRRSRTPVAARDLLESLKPRLSAIPTATLSGTYPVLYRPHSRSPRWIAHLTAPPETSDAEITRVLEPLLATNALIDLDPVAFFE